MMSITVWLRCWPHWQGPGCVQASRIVKPSGESPLRFWVGPPGPLELEMNLDLRAQLQKLNIIKGNWSWWWSESYHNFCSRSWTEISPENPGPCWYVSWRSCSVGSTLSLLLRWEFCLKQTRKAIEKNKQKLPRSCTLVAVHDTILEDLVFQWDCGQENPHEARWQAARKAQHNSVEPKVLTFSGVL